MRRNKTKRKDAGYKIKTAVCLQNFKGVDLKHSRKAQITALHKFVFEVDGDRKNRQRLHEFQGFEYDQNNEVFKRKRQYVISNLNYAELTSICILLNLNPVEDDQMVYIFENLRKGQLLKDAVEDEGEDTDDADEDDDAENTVIGNEHNNVESDNEVRNDEGGYAAACSRRSSTSIRSNNELNRGVSSSRPAFNFKDVEYLFDKFDGDGHQSIHYGYLILKMLLAFINGQGVLSVMTNVVIPG